MHCDFCNLLANGDAAIAWSNPRLVVFADHRPIREGHMQIVPRAHVEVFDDLAPDLAAEIIHLGQRIAKAQKRLYGVDRVGFVFTGNEVPHVHAHVLPLHAADDITSARFREHRAGGRIALRQQRRVAQDLAEALGAPIL
ncbi:HIT family protein [Candidatus Rhodobacter oscarellae]|uniref:HIT family protein n=1 Tax=Candidatus Rhodobacter oscarellae TaxID=1675527 RepID=A0A0J9E3C5_9RHOB|nr:HIT family protein [Candidatus Rhodobacter lobularis]KMW56324.1 HIT family protein [Candidatus Rhodobacter lobularis]